MLWILLGCAAHTDPTPLVEHPAPVAEGALWLATGVLVDPEAGVLYLPTPEGELAAVDLETGEDRWRQAEATLAVALGGGQVGAWDARSHTEDGLHLLLLDGGDGRILSACPPIALPAWARTQPGSYPLSETTVEGRISGDGLVVSWSAAHWITGGARVRPGQRPPTALREQGVTACVDGALLPWEGPMVTPGRVGSVQTSGGTLGSPAPGEIQLVGEDGSPRWSRAVAVLDQEGRD